MGENGSCLYSASLRLIRFCYQIDDDQNITLIIVIHLNAVYACNAISKSNQ